MLHCVVLQQLVSQRIAREVAEKIAQCNRTFTRTAVTDSRPESGTLVSDPVY